MPRTFAEGLHQGVSDYSALSAQANLTMMSRLKAIAQMKQLEMMTGGGNGNYMYSPPGFTNLAAEKAKRLAQIDADNEASDKQMGGGPKLENTNMPDGSQTKFLSPDQLQEENAKPPLVVPIPGDSKPTLGIQPKTLGAPPKTFRYSGQNIPLVKTEVAGGKSTYKQDPLAMKQAEADIGVEKAVQEQTGKAQEASGINADSVVNALKLLEGSQKDVDENTPSLPIIGKLEPGRKAGLLNSFYGGPTGANPAVGPYEKTRHTAAYELAKIAISGPQGGGRVNEQGVKDFYEALPGLYSNKAERKRYVQHAVEMALGRREANFKRQYTPGSKAASDILSSVYGTESLNPDKKSLGNNSEGDIVTMTAPDGSQVPVHKSRVEEAKKDGLK